MIRKLFPRFDLLRYTNWTLTLAVLLLLVMGVLFVYSSCYVSEDQPVRSLYMRQIVWALVGFLCYIGFAVGDYRALRRWTWWIYGGSLALLILVLIVGTRVYGARRWLMVFGTGVQPAEFAKLAVVLMLARRLGWPGSYYGNLRQLAPVLLIVAAPVALIFRQPDLGTALVFAPIVFFMMFAAGVPLRMLGGFVALGVVLVVLVLAAVFLPMLSEQYPGLSAFFERWSVLSDYQRDRMLVFFRPGSDPLGAGWNRLQSEIAVGSGGLWGKGFLQGTQNILGFLPRSVAPTDFIYSVISEETGFVGSAIVLGLFALLFWSGLRTAAQARDKMGRLLSTGVMVMLFTHVVVNVGMTVGLMPITGLPLPLLSYGGSFMIVVMSGLGLVQSVHIRSRRVVY